METPSAAFLLFHHARSKLWTLVQDFQLLLIFLGVRLLGSSSHQQRAIGWAHSFSRPFVLLTQDAKSQRESWFFG